MRATVCTFTFGCKLHCKSWPVIWAAELDPCEREKSGIWSGTKRRTGRFMGREMIYGAIVENIDPLADQRTLKLPHLPLASKCYHAIDNGLITCAWEKWRGGLPWFLPNEAIRISWIFLKETGVPESFIESWSRNYYFVDGGSKEKEITKN